MPAGSGDFDGAGRVDISDYGLFHDCATGTREGTECGPADFDLDGDVDLLDWGAFQIAFTETEQ